MSCGKNRYKRLFKAILGISIIGMLAINNLVFLHSHKLPNGFIIIHAHPFNKKQDTDPFKIHKHTTAELFLMQDLQLFLFAATFVLMAVYGKKIRLVFEENAESYLRSYVFEFKVRPPPAILFSHNSK